MPRQKHPVVRRADRPGDLGWVVMAHGEIYAQQFGLNTEFEALVTQIVADYTKSSDQARKAAWIAETDGQRAGSVFCVPGDQPDAAQLRVLLITSHARGLGLGTRLVQTCVAFARSAGYRYLTLWTDAVLESARRIYRSAGFVLVSQAPHHSFGHGLLGEHWVLDLHNKPKHE